MQFVVTAGPHPIENLPVSAVIEKEAREVKLTCGGKAVPAQAEVASGKTTVHWIIDKLAAGEQKTYDVAMGAGEKTAGVEISDVGGGKLEVKIGGEMFTRYHWAKDWPRPFLYPIIGPDKIAVTRNFPMANVEGEIQDHKHHRSIYVAYGDVNGTDNWSEEQNHASMWDTGHKFSSGTVMGSITSTNDWVSKEGVKQMEDERTFTFYNLPNSERIIDVQVVLKATVGDVHLKDTKEGGIISVRVATTMQGNQGGTIENAWGGKTERETWGKPAPWVDYYGPVEGKTLGIAVMDHPSSFRYPARWHVRDYGLFTANPFALHDYEPDRGWNGDHTMTKGESLNFRYRIYIHKGDTKAADVSDRFLGFIFPPKIELVE